MNKHYKNYLLIMMLSIMITAPIFSATFRNTPQALSDLKQRHHFELRKHNAYLQLLDNERKYLENYDEKLITLGKNQEQQLVQNLQKISSDLKILMQKSLQSLKNTNANFNTFLNAFLNKLEILKNQVDKAEKTEGCSSELINKFKTQIAALKIQGDRLALAYYEFLKGPLFNSTEPLNALIQEQEHLMREHLKLEQKIATNTGTPASSAAASPIGSNDGPTGSSGSGSSTSIESSAAVTPVFSATPNPSDSTTTFTGPNSSGSTPSIGRSDQRPPANFFAISAQSRNISPARPSTTRTPLPLNYLFNSIPPAPLIPTPQPQSMLSHRSSFSSASAAVRSPLLQPQRTIVPRSASLSSDDSITLTAEDNDTELPAPTTLVPQSQSLLLPSNTSSSASTVVPPVVASTSLLSQRSLIPTNQGSTPQFQPRSTLLSTSNPFLTTSSSFIPLINPSSTSQQTDRNAMADLKEEILFDYLIKAEQKASGLLKEFVDSSTSNFFTEWHPYAWTHYNDTIVKTVKFKENATQDEALLIICLDSNNIINSRVSTQWNYNWETIKINLSEIIRITGIASIVEKNTTKQTNNSFILEFPTKELAQPYLNLLQQTTPQPQSMPSHRSTSLSASTGAPQSHLSSSFSAAASPTGRKNVWPSAFSSGPSTERPWPTNTHSPASAFASHSFPLEPLERSSSSTMTFAVQPSAAHERNRLQRTLEETNRRQSMARRSRSPLLTPFRMNPSQSLQSTVSATLRH